jgi:hypothetical protein
MTALGFSGVLAEVVGFYVITYPAFVFPVLIRAKQLGARISERTKIISMIHYVVTAVLLGGFGLYGYLVAIGLPAAEAFSIGPILAGMVALGLLCVVSKLERQWTSKATLPSRCPSPDTALATPVSLWSNRAGALAFLVALCASMPLYLMATFVILSGFGLSYPPSIPYTAIALGVITGALTYFYSASGWVKSTWASILLLAWAVPCLLVGGYVAAVCLVPLYLSSLWGNRLGDRERVSRLMEALREQLGPDRTLDLKQVRWLGGERDLVRFGWKYGLLTVALNRMGYYISSSFVVEPVRTMQG